jgi:hypothetical protein
MPSSPKYFHIKRVATGEDFLVRAIKQAVAVSSVAGGPAKITVASNDDIVACNGALHEASRPEGEGKIFLVQKSNSKVLVRAKTAVDVATIILDKNELDVSVASQDTLVRLLGAGVRPIDTTDASTAAGPAAGDDAAGTGGGTATAGTRSEALVTEGTAPQEDPQPAESLAPADDTTTTTFAVSATAEPAANSADADASVDTDALESKAA